MKITVDVDVTPEELRRFIGLPDVEKLQQEMLKAAQKYLKESGQSHYSDMINAAMQPMTAYRQLLGQFLNVTDSAKKRRAGKSSDETPPE